jgi:hypothetical protein
MISTLLLTVAIFGCNSEKVLKVSDPDVAKPVSLEGLAALAVVHAGAIGDFQVAYSGSSGSEGQVQMSALLGDEYINSETFPTRIEVDQRQIQEENSTMQGIFRDIQRARASGDFASGKFAAAIPNDIRRAEALNIAGFAIVVMAENYCSGVPLSRLTDTGEIIYGTPRTTAQLWDDAVAKFDSAATIAIANGSAGTTQLNLSRVGKGRALLNKADYANAAAAVASVPTTFTYLVRHSENTGRENNGVYVFQRVASRFSATDKEGVNGLPYRSDADPRVKETRSGVGFDGSTPMWYVDLGPNTWAPQGKYPLRSSSAPLATGIEARLIEAEAALKAGATATYLAKINEERGAQGLTATSLPAASSDQVDQLFKERAYSLWFTSHRLGDMRRLVRQYNRTSESVFPTGAYFKGGNYGTDVNIIIPLDEKNNLNFTGCLDRKA